VVEKGLSVRETEALVQHLKAGKEPRRKRAEQKEPHILALEASLQENLGTKVQIWPAGKREELK